MEQRGYASTSDALLSLVLGACLALLVAGWVVAASPVFGAAVAGCALVALCAAVKDVYKRQTPDRIENLLTREHDVGAFGEQKEDVVLFCG